MRAGEPSKPKCGFFKEQTMVSYFFGFTMAREKSYFGRIWPPKTKTYFDKRFVGLVEQVRSIMDLTQVGAASNSNSIFYSTLELATLPGTTPIFWWSLPSDFIRKLIIREVTIVAIYNPVSMLCAAAAVGLWRGLSWGYWLAVGLDCYKSTWKREQRRARYRAKSNRGSSYRNSIIGVSDNE